MSEGSDYRLSLADGPVPAARRGSLVIYRAFARRPSELIHLDGADCAFAASRPNSSSPAIKDRERPSGVSVHRDRHARAFPMMDRDPVAKGAKARRPLAIHRSTGG